MEREKLGDFIQNLRRIFQDYERLEQKETRYLDLGTLSECDQEQLLQSRDSLPVENPLSCAFSEIINALQKGQLALAKMGINELLQLFLSQTKHDSSNGLTREMFLEQLSLIVLYITQEGFPYEHYFFEYLLRCYQPVCSFLLSQQREKEIDSFMEHLTTVGKIAAQRQLDTCSIHHLLRNIETFAWEKQLKDLAAKARDNRHTLEI